MLCQDTRSWTVYAGWAFLLALMPGCGSRHTNPSPETNHIRETPPPAAAPFPADQARRLQEHWAKHLEIQVESINSIGITMILIPPGDFLMGSTQEQYEEALRGATNPNRAEVFAREMPAHRVRITQPFQLGRTSVTVAQFRAFVGATGYVTETERDGRGGFGMIDRKWVRDPKYTWETGPGFEQSDEDPVVNVSWHDAAAFCQWLSEKEGATYRLPTEAEWEYACRAGSAALWYSGDDPAALVDYAWFDPNSDWHTHPVGTKKPNAFGLYDMTGNARNWCADWFEESYYAKSPLEDPPGATSGTRRLVRGAAVHAKAEFLRSAMRYADPPEHRMGQLGFRVARDVGND